jgi:murein DD-endopeptidase MepM/ murein hydrolase activator NlpD
MRLRWSAVKRGAGGIALVVVGLFVAPFGGALSEAETTSALRVEVSGPPQAVFGSDGREHIEYDLVITNAFTADATLKSLEVRGGGHRLLSLKGTALGDSTLTLGLSKPTGGHVAPSSTVATQVDVVLPRSAGRTVPGVVTSQIRYAIPAKAVARPIIGTTTVEVPAVRVDRRAPVVIASPLRGTGWVDANGCCHDPSSPHRQTLLPTSSGGYITPEMFAIDWVRLVNGRLFTGDGSKNSDWAAFGSSLYAVANGTVVFAVDDKPDIAPNSDNPFLGTPLDFAGNTVELRIGPGSYACYAHMILGSVRVRTGQRVRAGQRIGLLGNSGNTTGPHLHFGIQSRPGCLSRSEPFEIDRFTLQGTAAATGTPGRIRVIGPSRRERRSLPLIRSVDTFLPPAR